jgi:hypothetical protein
MANILAVHSVGNSIVTWLRNSYPAMLAGRPMPACAFDLVSCGQLAGDVEETTRVTLLLHRVAVNEHARQSRPANAAADGRAPLSLDLHYLLTAWAATPLDEQITFAWTLRQLHQHPVLDASSLSPEAGWARDEVIQIVPSELSTEDMMRIWDALDPSYRLSATYVARYVRLDPDAPEEFRPVVARGLALGTESDHSGTEAAS